MTQCNPHIKFFICSAFAPMCPDQLPQAVTSCRSVCEEVKRDCIKFLQQFDVQWPVPLDCSNFPEGPDLCMVPEEPTFRPHPIDVQGDSKRIQISSNSFPSCPVDLVDLDSSDRNSSCVFKCNRETMFPKAAKVFIQKYSFLASAVSMGITTITVLCFLVDIHRFRFPERSIFYIAVCQLLYVVPYFARGFLDHEQMSCDRFGVNEKYILVHQSLENSVCVVSTFFTFYFSLAGLLWWLMLTFTWFLSASRKWVQEEIEKRATYLHIVSWGIPAFAMIFVLITQSIDGNELTGICGVGFLNPWMLIFGSIVPESVILFFGLIFSLFGFWSMNRERQCFKHRGTDTSKLDKFITKMTFFTFFYISLMGAVLFCDFYHLQVLQKWHPSTIDCKVSGGAERGVCRRPPQPEVFFYFVRTLFSILLGTLTSIWMLSTKTIKSWKEFICCGYCSPPKEKFQTTLLQNTVQPNFNRSSLEVGRIPQRNPNFSQNSQYLPLSVMTTSGNNGGISITYAGNPDQWKASKIV
ncbi:hypothetical protein FO519_008511 [Halicephalobus sp. NKZ332]|nr:hypothetical protein FO519_008511 [Halicephalobus sp. NKZ332]